MHRDLRHEFTMGLQGVRKVLPVQAYFVNRCVPTVPVREDAKGVEVQVVETESTIDLSAAETAATATAKEQEDHNGQRKN